MCRLRLKTIAFALVTLFVTDHALATISPPTNSIEAHLQATGSNGRESTQYLSDNKDTRNHYNKTLPLRLAQDGGNTVCYSKANIQGALKENSVDINCLLKTVNPICSTKYTSAPVNQASASSNVIFSDTWILKSNSYPKGSQILVAFDPGLSFSIYWNVRGTPHQPKMPDAVNYSVGVLVKITGGKTLIGNAASMDGTTVPGSFLTTALPASGQQVFFVPIVDTTVANPPTPAYMLMEVGHQYKISMTLTSLATLNGLRTGGAVFCNGSGSASFYAKLQAYVSPWRGIIGFYQETAGHYTRNTQK